VEKALVLVLVGRAPVGDPDHSDGVVADTERNSQKCTDFGMTGGLSDPKRVGAGIDGANRTILKDGGGEKVGSQRDQTVAGVELLAGVEAVNRGDVHGAGVETTQPDEAELGTGQSEAMAESHIQNRVHAAEPGELNRQVVEGFDLMPAIDDFLPGDRHGASLLLGWWERHR
jgi:hypothetical protein